MGAFLPFPKDLMRHTMEPMSARRIRAKAVKAMLSVTVMERGAKVSVSWYLPAGSETARNT